MNERQPLNFLLAAADLATTEPIVPFPAFRGEDPCIVTAVLERTAICGSTTDHYERMAVKHQDVLVDPAMVEWKARAVTASKQNGQSTPWLGRSKKASSEERQAAREKSDRKALENQAAVARTLAAEQAKDVETRTQSVKDLSDRATPAEHRVPPVIARRHADRAAPAAAEPASNVEAKPEEPLKFCPGCKKEKPRSEFPTGKGFYQCNDCRAAKLIKEDSTEGAIARATREEREERGLKHCPSCDQDKTPEEFDRNATKPDGHQSICKACRSTTWTTGSTAVRRTKQPPAEPETIAPSDRVSAPRRPRGRPALTFKELLGDLKQLSAYCRELESENEQLRAEQAGLYDELHAIVGTFKKSRAKS